MPDLIDSIFLLPAVAFVIAALGMPIVIRAAYRLGWVARPRADRWHSRPVALMGGAGIVISFVATMAVSGRLLDVAPLVLAALALSVLGAVDDRISVQPLPKLVIELACAALVVGLGYRFAPELPAFVSIPLTVLWVIGVTNAINLLDNMNGLAAGVAALIAGGVGVLCALGGDFQHAALAFGVSGACLGFLLYNFPNARVFMGDTGSLFLGFLVSVLALHSRAHLTGAAAPVASLAPLLLAAIPLMDTALVVATRRRAGRPISLGGRDHSSHRLVYHGLSETASVLTLHGLTVAVVATALVASRVGAGVLVAGVVTALVGLGALAIRLSHYDAYSPAPAVPAAAAAPAMPAMAVAPFVPDVAVAPIAPVAIPLPAEIALRRSGSARRVLAVSGALSPDGEA